MKNNLKNNLSLTLIILCILTSASAQNLEVEGTVKITDMALKNTADSVVVYLPDKTLARRDVSTLKPELTGAICNLYFQLCQPEPAICANVIPNVTVTSDMGECCGGSLNAMLDGSGLSSFGYLGTHDVADNTGWKSNSVLVGFLLFDFQTSYNLQRIAIWNHGQLGGDRGVMNMTIETSQDGVNFVPLPNGPTQLTEATVTPVGAEKFILSAAVTARYVRFNITSGYGAANLGLGEVMFWAD